MHTLQQLKVQEYFQICNLLKKSKGLLGIILLYIYKHKQSILNFHANYAMSPTIGKTFILFLLSILYRFSTIVSHQHHHPLDPLTPSEFNLVRTIIENSYSGLNHSLTFHYVGLDDPDKQTTLSWVSNPNTTLAPPRRAFVITRLDKDTHEIIVDLSTNSIISDQIYHGHGYPLLTGNEIVAALQLPMTYPPFVESVKRRGLNLSDVVCSPSIVGWFGEAETSRVLKIQCFYIGKKL